MNTVPICVAPWNNILIDTNKGVKPCCAYNGEHLGYITKSSIQDIITGPAWQDIKNKLIMGEWPEACDIGCRQTEERTGWSVRLSLQNDMKSCYEGIDYNNNEIVYMEFNGSYICNIACLQCNPSFSSRWVPEWEKLNLRKYDSPGELPDIELIKKSLDQLNLDKLRIIFFKGGDPLMNEETYTVLDYLDQRGILPTLEVCLFTNGTHRPKNIFEKLKRVKRLVLNLSIDGAGELNKYIRFGADTSIENIEQTLKQLNENGNCEFNFSVSIMVYNIFDIVNIRNLWRDWQTKYKSTDHIYFRNMVWWPRFLNSNVLTDYTRNKLVDFYTDNNVNNEFNFIINYLRKDYLGNDLHNQWIDYTKKMEKNRRNSILDIVPELATEFQYLT
jgi:MoaA/NifB/PqqE/SkfB family radical SAM enzyme